ncbi:MAG: TetR/AcrR family transcriptional regulator [Planctomycetes bacterium]|nr:TetR/AcrR family transcriptional regulator [Planctomycetota bacterium]
MKAARIDIAGIRREQIVNAAVSVIAEQGLQNLSLSEIEKKVGMSRGQLTYYFKAKEDILVAVFDRLLVLLFKEHGGAPNMCVEDHPLFKLAWPEFLGVLLRQLFCHPPRHPEFHALQYTFLSQISHRADFRERLASLYERWRSDGSVHLARDFAKAPPARNVSPRALATLTQAIIHGLVVQTAVDGDAFDREEVIELALDMMRNYLWPNDRPGNHHAVLSAKKTRNRTNKKNGAGPRGARPSQNGVKHE